MHIVLPILLAMAVLPLLLTWSIIGLVKIAPGLAELVVDWVMRAAATVIVVAITLHSDTALGKEPRASWTVLAATYVGWAGR